MMQLKNHAIEIDYIEYLIIYVISIYSGTI